MAWLGLAAEIFGFGGALLLTRWAFPMPTPYQRLTKILIASVVMAIVVRGLDLVAAPSDKLALADSVRSGVASYLIMCWCSISPKAGTT